MAFVKLDCGILDSTLWPDLEAREVFITALLMADPTEVKEELDQIEVGKIKATGFKVPVGWYGFVAASGPGIVRRAGLDLKKGMAAMERLGAPDPESRTADFDGRRMVRVDGGFVVLNFDRYRIKDHTAAERSRRYRERMLKIDLPVSGKTPSPVVAPPESLNTPEFLSAMERWEKHRKELRHPMTPSCREALLKKISGWGVARGIAAINHSIENGWQGLFEPNERNNGSKTSQRNTAPNPRNAHTCPTTTDFPSASKLASERTRARVAEQMASDQNKSAPSPAET